MAAIPIRRSPHPEIEAHIHEALVARRIERDARGPKRLLRLSSIGDCPRKLWALAHGHEAEEIPGARLALFDMGSSVEELVIGWLRAAGYTIKRTQQKVTLIEGVDGHIDGEIWLERSRFNVEPAVLEVKSANAEQFEQCVARGYDAWRPAYGDTLQTYMGASGVHVSLPVVFCKDNSKLYAEKIRFDAERYESLKAKAEAVLHSPTLLPRPEEATSQHCTFCRWCHLAEWCWGPTAEVQFDD